MTQAESRDFTAHGGRIDAARARWPDAPGPWIDLSTGINPHGWVPPPDLAVDPRALPDPTALEEAAAACFGVDAARVAAVPGSEIALRLLPALGLARPIVATRPSYASYAAVADTMDSMDTVAGTRLCANPNNPDGRFLDACPAGAVVIDEAFVDATPERSLLRSDGDAIVLRSFGKFFGLAGLRLGFVVAPPAIVARVRRLLGDWPVAAHAVAWGIAAYRDREWIAATRAALPVHAARLDQLLARHGLVARGDCALFRLVEHRDAPTLFTRLARAGILVRPFADRPDWLRFGLPADEAAIMRLDRALDG